MGAFDMDLFWQKLSDGIHDENGLSSSSDFVLCVVGELATA
jgi:hypothetical protein